MKCLLFLFLCVFLTTQCNPTLSNPSVAIQHDISNYDYVELEEGTFFHIACELTPEIEWNDLVYTTWNFFLFHFRNLFVSRRSSETLSRVFGRQSHKWTIPYNGDLEGFDRFDDTQRISTKVDCDSEHVHHLFIDNAKPTDTGIYKCMETKETTVSTTEVFIFVKRKTGNIFLDKKWNAEVVNPKNITISCRATERLQPDSVAFYINNVEIATAKEKYDSRYGLHLNASDLKEYTLESVNVSCVHRTTGHQWHIVIMASHEMPELSFETGNKVLNEGATDVELECVLWNPPEGNDYYQMTITCPRCSDDSAVLQRRVFDKNKATVFMRIRTVTKEDEGTYNCSWYDNNVQQGATSFFFKVHEQFYRFLLEEKSPPEQSVVVHESMPIVLSASFAIVPKNHSMLCTQWSKNGLGSSSEKNGSLFVDKLERNVEKRGMLRETLMINKSTLESGGLYALAVGCAGHSQFIEWSVIVLGTKPQMKVQISDSDGYTVANETFHKLGANLRVECRGSSPAPQIELQLRSHGENSSISADELKRESGIHESVIIWNTALKDNLHLYCEKNTSEQHEFDELLIYAGDTPPLAVIERVERASVHNDDAIFFGDKVTLLCIVPDHPNILPTWFVNDNSLTDVKFEHYQHSILLYAYITNTIDMDREVEYTCKIMNRAQNVFYEHLNVTVLYHELKAPWLNESSTSETLIVKYKEPAVLSCDMQGAPTPEITWYKDSKPLYNNANDRSLTTGRVVNYGKSLQFDHVLEDDYGHYACAGSNQAGHATSSFLIEVIGVPSRPVTAAQITVWSLLFLLFLLLILCLFYLYARHRKQQARWKREMDILHNELNNGASDFLASNKIGSQVFLGEKVQQLAYNREFEIDIKNLKIENEIGTGAFARVAMGKLANATNLGTNSDAQKKQLPVAIKMPRTKRARYSVYEQKVLVDELKCMTFLKHPNVISLIGAVTEFFKEGQLYIVMELCETNLRDFLRKYGENQSLFDNELVEDRYVNQDAVDASLAEHPENDSLLEKSGRLATSDLISFSMQIANGMEYLNRQLCLHRDLAARNILLTKNQICRIADFGLAKQQTTKKYYRLNAQTLFPLRWTAPEAFEKSICLPESDVWSFAILLYEIFTLGGCPYPDCPDEKLKGKIYKGLRNEKPIYAPAEIYLLMAKCWHHQPKERPTSRECLDALREHLKLASPQLYKRVHRQLVEEWEILESYAEWRGTQRT